MVYKVEFLKRSLSKLEEYFSDLSKYKSLKMEDYLQKKETRYAIERIIFLVSENIIDMLDHILSAKFKVTSDTYEEVILNSFKYKIIPKDIYDKLKGLGKFRNVLAHEYLELDDELVFKGFKKILKIEKDIINFFKEFIQAEKKKE
jgi:uncharacterized protein YutE (UPF0331/DUF86 family)